MRDLSVVFVLLSSIVTIIATIIVTTEGLTLEVVAKAENTQAAAESKILKPFKQNLKQALLSDLNQCTITAIESCKLEAPVIADSLSANNIRVGRTSQRLRNPQNVSPQWLTWILKEYQQNQSQLTPKTVSIISHRSDYVETIVLQPICLACHGESLSPEVNAKLSELYPSGQVAGYRVGDLRGIFSTEYPVVDEINH